MNSVLEEWNEADEQIAIDAMLACCGSRRWTAQMVALRPIASLAELSEVADRVWGTMGEPDWMEAFARHPRIGERKAIPALGTSGSWSQEEQAGTKSASDDTMRELYQGNSLYEEKFGFTYIVCATGKTGDEMLAILKRRLSNDRMSELKEAAEQQRQIMQLRLGKWMLS